MARPAPPVNHGDRQNKARAIMAYDSSDNTIYLVARTVIHDHRRIGEMIKRFAREAGEERLSGPAWQLRRAPASGKLGYRQHQPHQVRLPRDLKLLVDLPQMPIDRAVLAARRHGNVTHGPAFSQPDRHLTLRARKP